MTGLKIKTANLVGVDWLLEINIGNVVIFLALL